MVALEKEAEKDLKQNERESEEGQRDKLDMLKIVHNEKGGLDPLDAGDNGYMKHQ